MALFISSFAVLAQALCLTNAFFVPATRVARRGIKPLRAAATGDEVALFPFASEPETTAALWERIDDVVMGGVSSSKIVATEGGGAEWRGIVRTDGGGFCGTRTATLEEPLDLSAYDGIYIDAALVSDEDVARRAWKCTIRTGASRGEVVHSAEWTPSVGEGGAPCRVPFEDFKLVRGPRLVEGAPPLNASACEKVYGFGLTLSKFGAARPGATPVVENFRDGPFAVKLNGVGCYGAAAAVAAAPKRLAVGGSKPNSPGSPIKTNGIILGVALALLRPIASLVFSEEGRRRAQARKQLVQGGKAKNGWAARRYGQRVIKSGVKGLGPVAAAAEGLREFAKDSAAYLLSLPLRLMFRGIFGLARLIRKLQGKKPMPAL
mmetsp:Transcript_25954/g.80835  ORF Transcript_25954/g.80835 Transcript_25954/m.80835 type:complete len:377 (+) Transcript_25954:313-1443(+)